MVSTIFPVFSKAKYQAQLNEYSRFCKKMGLTEQRERIYYDMRGKVAPYNKSRYRLSDTTDKWAKLARKELLMDEKSLTHRSKETAVIYDAKGNYLFTKRGNEKSVEFQSSELKRMKNCIVTHNHPSEGSFSAADWKLFKVAELEEVRAISGNKVYYLRKTKKSKINHVDADDLVIEFKKLKKKVRIKYQKLYENGTINKRERFLMSSNEYNRLLAEKYGLEYGEELLDG